MQPPKGLCDRCGSRRSLKRVTIHVAGEDSKKFDMCRPCHSAVKEWIRHQARPQTGSGVVAADLIEASARAQATA